MTYAFIHTDLHGLDICPFPGEGLESFSTKYSDSASAEVEGNGSRQQSSGDFVFLSLIENSTYLSIFLNSTFAISGTVVYDQFLHISFNSLNCFKVHHESKFSTTFPSTFPHGRVSMYSTAELVTGIMCRMQSVN